MHNKYLSSNRLAITLLLAFLPGLLYGRPACELTPGVATPDMSADIQAWQYPEYPDNQCIRRLPEDSVLGNSIGHPLATTLVGDFSGDGCDQDVLWRIPGLDSWILNKGLGGSEVIADGNSNFSGLDPNQVIGTYEIGLSGQEGIVWSIAQNGIRTTYRLDGSQDTQADAGVSAWLNLHPEVVQFKPTMQTIVAIGDSFVAGAYSDPIANFRELLWQQLFEFSTCERELALDWVGSVRDYNKHGEPFLYGNNFYTDKEHEGHGGFKSCEIQQCISAWMDGHLCIQDNSDSEICAVEKGDLQSTPYTPDIALLMLGMNDLLSGNPDTTTPYRQAFLHLNDTAIIQSSIDYISKVMTDIRLRNTKAVFALAGLPAVGNTLGLSAWEGYETGGDPYLESLLNGREYLANKNYRRFNHAIQQTAVLEATAESPIIYVDQYTQFAGVPGVQWDRLHPSYGGHQQIADEYALALTKFWDTDGTCALKGVNPYANKSNAIFLIGDFNADSCGQDIAYRAYFSESWSNRWWVRPAGASSPYPLAPDTSDAIFESGDLKQFIATIDFDSDGLLDIVWRNNLDTGWQINFGDKNKESSYIQDYYSNTAPVFDVTNEELVVIFCNWGGNNMLGWTEQIEVDKPLWHFIQTDGQAKEEELNGDWRNFFAWLSVGQSSNPPCTVVGNH